MCGTAYTYDVGDVISAKAPRWLPPGLAVWFAAALVAAWSGAVARSPVPPPAIAVGLAAALILVYWLVPAARRSLDAVPTAALVALHLVRVVAGANFLRLAATDELPVEFAGVAGWGDVAVGIGAALVLVFCLPPHTTGRRRALLAWNTLGLADILLVLGNGTRLFLRDASLAGPFTSLPVALLPLFVVPLVITSHALLFARHS